jgi:crotonobetainyl-CoA:carnitine CoA-transferase CaiB-like acyl-CoA transferase
LSSSPNIPASTPLAGVKVVEIGTSVAAPYAGWVLAALGADVVKVERPDGGDDARQWGRMLADGSSSYYNAFNRDKRGVTVDIKDEADREWLRRYCIEQADVVIQNMRPGLAAKHGLGADELTAANPRLVYCNMGAFGRLGPLAGRPGYDPLMQAFGGIMSVTGEEGRPPIRVGTSIVDMGTGMWSVIGILSALNRRHATGAGCIVDTSLYETALGWMTHHASTVQVTGENPDRQGSGARGMAPYQAYQCEDGWLVVAAPNDRLFTKLSAVLGRPEWPADERFSGNQQRYRNLPALNALIEPIIRERTREQWRAALEEAGIPCAPVRTTLEMMDEAQTRALGMLQRLDPARPELMGLPVSFDGDRPAMRNFAPRLGEHNEEVKKR